MPAPNPGEVGMVDFGMTAKVRPALLLTGEPAGSFQQARSDCRVLADHQRPGQKLLVRGTGRVM